MQSAADGGELRNDWKGAWRAASAEARLALVTHRQHFDAAGAGAMTVEGDVAASAMADGQFAQRRIDWPADLRVAFEHGRRVEDRLQRLVQPNGRTPISGPCRYSANTNQASTPTTTEVRSLPRAPAPRVVPAARSRRRSAA